jgi:hypothetical protein
MTKARTIEAKARIMPTGDMGTDDLFGLAFASLAWLKSLMQRRTRRDAACNTLTHLSVAVDHLAKRLAKLKFDERAPSILDEEEEDRGERASEATIADLFAEPEPRTAADISYLQAQLAGHLSSELEVWLSEETRDVLGRLCGELERIRKRDFATAMELFCKDARNLEEVSKRVVTTMQATMPGLIEKHFGLSLTSVGGRMGEGRATTQARKKRVVEKTLRLAGMKGFKGLGGARSDQHRERCAEAQKGNQSRAKGEARKRAG